MVEKLVRNGEVAVIYSPGFGAGWSTWASGEMAEMVLFDKDIAEAVLADDLDKAAKIAQEKAKSIGDGYFYTGGSDQLTVAWLSEGTDFEVHEYDGSETIRIIANIEHYTA